MNRPFHAAYHVYDLDEARIFYRDVLGCTEGRCSETWIDFDFFGNQLSLHLGTPFPTTRTSLVGEHQGEHSSLTAAAAVVAKQLDVGKQSVRRWVLQSQIDGGQRCS